MNNLLIITLIHIFICGDAFLDIPHNAVGAPKLNHRNRKVEFEDQRADVPENRCYCNYGDGICDKNYTCIKHAMAACFHATKEVYDKLNLRMATQHYWGCAPLEKGSNASHLTCNAYRSHHTKPSSIICCYEGNYCNKDLEPPKPLNLDNDTSSSDSGILYRTLQTPLIVILPLVVSFILFCIFFSLLYYLRCRRSTPKETDLSQEKEAFLYDIDDSGSGSGSGQTTLNQRTVAKDLEIIETIGRGRYGEVRKAIYRSSLVAVKTFYTTDENSWQNERDIFLTYMLNHENILQFVAADICSQDSVTKMLLVTDFHELGSLHDYLRNSQSISPKEALDLAYSSICGIDHLHAAVYGTGSQRKPEIAHRDLKSKNIIVKSTGICCIADFGLAIRIENGRTIPEKPNIQVGTKRYMAPEVLSNSLNPLSFAQFKQADIYSLALVLWEIFNRMESGLKKKSDETDSGFCSHEESPSNSGENQVEQCAPMQILAGESAPVTQNFQVLQSAIQPLFVSGNSSSGYNSSSGVSTFIRSSPNQMPEYAPMSTGGSAPTTTSFPLQQKTVQPSYVSGNSDSSGYGSIGKPTVIPSVDSKDYQQPYEGLVGNDPSFEEMSNIVCHQQRRPPTLDKWNNHLHLLWLREVANLLDICWHSISSRRHTALKIKMEMKRIMMEFSKNDKMTQGMSSAYSQEQQRMETMEKDDSGCKSQSDPQSPFETNLI